MKLSYAILLGLSGVSAIALPLQAQITIDGTTNTILDNNGNSIIINGGDRAGDNLFHSFQEFSVVNGGEAYFNNAADISNIFSRVTGGNISNIDGLLRANGGANLFIINPAGIIFSENASIDIGGSFFATTADSILFSDGIEFSALDSENPPLLTINQPVGLVLGNNPGAIVNQSVADDVGLQVSPGNNLTLVGGDIEFNSGTIFAPGANIELGGLSAAGEISIDADGSLSFPEDIARADVTLTNGTYIDVQAEGGGNITVNANNIELSSGELGFSSLFAGIAPDSGSPDAQVGDITLDAIGDISISDSIVGNNVEEFGIGNSGNININATNLNLTNGGLISADVFGIGNGGTIIINTSDTISLSGEDSSGVPSFISSDLLGEGNAGNIEIKTANLFLTKGSYLSSITYSIGNAGNITIKASDTITIDGETSTGIPSGIRSQVYQAEGDGGDIEITTANLSLTKGGFISSSTFAIGNGGNITITASDTINIDGETSTGFPGGIGSQVALVGEGDAGDVKITTAHLSLTGGAIISSSIFAIGNGGDITIEASDTITIDGEGLSGVSSIDSQVALVGEGDGGKIDITTAHLSLTGGASITSSTLAIGDGGDITIRALDTITIDGESLSGLFSNISSGVGIEAKGDAAKIEITTGNLLVNNRGLIRVDSLGQGDGGNLFIRANSLILDNESSLLASTSVGTGGNIELQIADNIILSNNSLISAEALNNANGGNVIIDTDTIVAFPNQNNDIIAAAEQGRGGEIDITTSAIFGIDERSSIPENNTNDLDASSEFGIDGTISINELDVNPAEGLEELPIEVIDVASLVAQNLCQQGEGSEFILTGKGGLAASPNQTRDSNLSQVDLVEPVLTSPPTPQPLPQPLSLGQHSLASYADAGSDRSYKERGEIQGEGRNTRGGEKEKEIVEAQGWVVNSRGVLELVAQKTNAISSLPQPKYDNICPK